MKPLIRRGGWTAAIRPLAADEAVPAVGDVHGQDDLFEALLDALSPDLQAASRAALVQLGDLVDRGPGSLAALRRAKAGLPGVESVTLMGNHEDRMLSAILSEDPEEHAMWLEFGAGETLAEAGVGFDRPDWREAFTTALGRELIDWLTQLPKLHRIGDLAFVHAGLDPALPLSEQSARTLMWTRRPWLESRGPYDGGVAVIHGHTPQPQVDLSHPHRINLDTGAFRTGALSALLIVGDRMRVVQAVRP